MGCKRTLVIEMEVRVSVYLIITIICLYIAINKLMGRKPIFNLNYLTLSIIGYISHVNTTNYVSLIGLKVKEIDESHVTPLYLLHVENK